jgi:hypothetical protein
MPGYLRQSTASQAKTLGPFVNDTDFISPEAGLTIANTDIKLNKNGAAAANKNSGGGTSVSNGNYVATFDATDSDTVGELAVTVIVSGAAPYFDRFVVLEEAVYDALFAASAPGYGVAQTGDSYAVVNHATHGLAAAWGYLTNGYWGLHRIYPKLVYGVASIEQIDKTGYALSSAGALAIWEKLTSALTASGSIGKWIVDKLDVVVSTRLAPTTAGRTLTTTATGAASVNWGDVENKTTTNALTGTTISTSQVVASVAGAVGSVTGLTTATIADAVWDEALAGHAAGGSAGAALTGAGSAGDPWTTALPGAYGSGTAGKIIGDNINATISSRLADASYTAPPTVGAVADAVWDEALAGHAAGGSAGAALTGAGTAGDPWATELPGAYGSGTAGKIVGDKIVASVTGDVGGNVTGSVGSLAAQAKADVNAEADAALADAGVTTTRTAKLASLNFTVAGQVNANAKSWNDNPTAGDGSSGDKARVEPA